MNKRISDIRTWLGEVWREADGPASARKPVVVGFATFGLFFGVLGLWASLAPISSAVIASGVVKVEGNRKALQHLDGGIVREILVKDGDLVKSGQPLVRLDDTQIKASVATYGGELDAQVAAEARLKAERDDKPQVDFPDELKSRAADPVVKDLLNAQTNLFEARRQAVLGQIDVLEQRRRQLEQQISGVKAQSKAVVRQSELVADELQGTKELYDQGFATKTRVLALERGMASIEGQRGEYASTIGRLEQGIAETKMQIAQVRKEHLTKVTAELSEVQTKVMELREKLRVARDMLDRTEMRAPSDGFVVGLTTFTIGGVVNRGEKVLEIVPVDAPLVVEATIQPQDVDDLAVGAQAEVKFTAFKQRGLPQMYGTITNISADRFTDQKSGMGYFLASIEIDRAKLEALGLPPLSAGMPADILVPTGSRTVMEYLLEPLTQSMQKAFREK